ncbi:polynucleotide 5'-hydroxyl-kinase NOL9, partial [Tanacetum coccineum]
MASNPENVRLTVLMKLQEALDEEAILEEQMLALMHRFADRFTDRRVEINNLMVLHDHQLIDYVKKEVTSMAVEILPPAEWEEAADIIAYDSATSPPLVCVVCGPANSGKTTFSRHLVNVLIHRYPKVAYMDTDVGQAEFTPPGCLSLTVIDEETRDLAIPCLRTPE